jgi:hypothetical protein
MPCGPDVSTKAFGNSLKKRIRPFVSSGPRLPQDPLDSHAACVSLSLSTMSISSGRQKPPNLKPEAHKTPGPPLRTPGSLDQPVGLSAPRPQRHQRRAPSVMRLIGEPPANCQASQFKKPHNSLKPLKRFRINMVPQREDGIDRSGSQASSRIADVHGTAFNMVNELETSS